MNSRIELILPIILLYTRIFFVGCTLRSMFAADSAVDAAPARAPRAHYCENNAAKYYVTHLFWVFL